MTESNTGAKVKSHYYPSYSNYNHIEQFSANHEPYTPFIEEIELNCQAAYVRNLSK